jgi:Uma2 family endonuclease
MATGIRTAIQDDDDVEYPTSDGKPMAETPIHRQNLTDLIDMLEDYFAGDPDFYVSGNMLMYYERGNPKKHVSPDVFFVRGIPHDRQRDAYKTWEEDGRGPDLVIELTSRSTRSEDTKKKYTLYRDVLRVREYILFDPKGDYLKPPLQGHRLEAGEYVAIEPVEGRLPSELLGLRFERNGSQLRIFDPARQRWLPTRAEARDMEADARRREAEARRRVENENEQLRRELEALRNRLDGTS